MANCCRRSELELRGPRERPPNRHPELPRVRSAQSFALNPVVTAKQAGGRAGGAFRRVSRGAEPPPRENA
eukprot:12308196-Alexandrium_andersonii.AAC.1